MATESIISLRGFARIAYALLLFSVCLCQGAGAQTNPSVVATGPISAVASHPATFGQVWETAISSKGDLVIDDFEQAALYEFPAGGGAMITLAAPGSSGPGGAWANMGVAIDPWDNLWIGQNWNSDLMRIPYDSVSHTWNLSGSNNTIYTSANLGTNPNWFQAGALAISSNAVNGTATMVVSAENAPALYSYSIDSSGNVTNGATVVNSLKGRARSLTIDTLGNIFLYEDGGVSGIVLVPAGTTGLANDKSLTRVDPNLSNPMGITVDVNGNVYVSDSKAGVYFVPNESGSPNPSDAVLMTAVPAYANVDFDLVHGIMYVPTKQGENGGWTSPSGTVYNDVVAVALSNLSLGSGAAYVQGAAQSISFGFAASETPASFEIVEAGATTTDFTVVSGGTCTVGTTYAAGSTCTVDVALLSHTLGDVSATLEMLDANSNILASVALSGIGMVPAVASGPPAGVQTHPATWGQVWNTAISSKGDLVIDDFEHAALYEFPAGGGAMITLAAPGTSGPGGAWANMSVAIDPWDNLWIGQNWNAELIRVPYDAVNQTWNLSGPNVITYQYSWNPGDQAFDNALTWFQAGAITFGSKITNGTATMVVSAENVPALYSFTVDASGNVPSGATVISSLKGRAKTLAIDNSGNIYFFEDGGASGVLRIPAGATNLANDKSLTRVDPKLPNPAGVAVDASGNVYVGDNNDGVYLVPNENGTPNPSDAYLLAAVPTEANVALDVLRGIMYVPTTQGENGGWNGINDVASVALTNVNLGSAAAGSQGTAATVNFGFGAGVTPANFTIEEAGSTTPDFVTASGGTCTTGSAYAAQSSCSVNVALSPHSAGGVSGKLLVLDAQSDILASMTLYGIAQGGAISVTPALEMPFGSGFMTPGEVATDAAGNSYVADAGLKKVLMYPPGAGATTVGVPVGTGLTAPTGVAVDGAGDVFIADSGNVYEVPNSPSGLNAAGQMTIKTGLGTTLNLAMDGLGNLYVADPQKARVVELANAGNSFLGQMDVTENDLTAGFTTPSVVAVDGSNNLYVVDGPKLLELQPNGTQSTLLNTLNNATGLAVDASGAVYVSSANSGTVRIPYVSGALNPGAQTVIGASVTNPAGLALDKAGNVYLTDATAENLHLVSINGTVNLGSPALGTPGTGTAEILNIGNSAFTVTGFLSSNAEDFSATGCGASVNPAATCTVDVTMNPGPGQQGPLSSTITIQSNAANLPVVDAVGTGPALALSKSTISVASTATVLSIPITATVASASGSNVPVPTGNVVVSVDGVAQPPATLANGTVTLTLVGIAAGSHTYTVAYVGDRVYGSSTGSASFTVAKGAPLVPLSSPPQYVLSTLDGDEPYDQSLASYYTNYVVKVSGAPSLVPTGTISFMQGSSVLCGALTLDATGSATFQPGCLPISIATNSPNEVTQQVINSVVYSGDSNYLGSTGGPITFEEIRQPSVALTPNPGSVNISGNTGSATLTITSVLGYGVSTNPAYPGSTPTLILNNYTLPLAFACQGLPARATCTFSGGNYTDLNGVLHTDEVVVNTDPSLPSTITVTVNANVSAGTTTSKISHSSPFEFAAMFGVSLVGLAFGRKSGRKARVLMLICLVILTGALAGITACSTTTLGSAPVLTTPSGTYSNVIVTAQQVGSTIVPGSQGPITLYGSQNQMSLPYSMTVTVQ